MTDQIRTALAPVSGRTLAAVGAPAETPLPVVFLRSQGAGKRFWEFFTVHIRNRHTRKAYFVAVSQFSAWCEQQKLRLEDIQPIHVAGYIEQLGAVVAKPTVKQHLAAIRMLFDWLVTGQIIPINPAHAVRGPRHSVKKGKTSVLSAEEMRTLLDSVDAATLIGLRDRALIALMGYTFARVGAALAMKVEDFYSEGKRWWLRLHEKGGKRHEVPAHHNAEAYAALGRVFIIARRPNVGLRLPESRRMSEPERPTRKSRLSEQGQETDLRDTTPEQRILMMWPLALDAWAPTGLPKGPSACAEHTAVAAGSRMIVWGGSVAGGAVTNEGGVLDLTKVP
jgi:site-specific recombinase XerD